MDFDALQEYNSPAVPSEVLEKLDALDVETLTPIEALNFLYELKKTLKGSLNGLSLIHIWPKAAAAPNSAKSSPESTR